MPAIKKGWGERDDRSAVALKQAVKPSFNDQRYRR